jgi:4-amino-4-deoxy-L-arabinose transferase-like glycosyltransferase
MIAGWQFWVWLTCVALVVGLFYRNVYEFSWKNFFLLGSLFSAAFLLRVIFLNILPGQLHLDEMGVAQYARDMLIGNNHTYQNMFVTGPSSQPTLHHYILHYTMELFGYTIFGLRISSVIAGSIGVLTTYLMIKQVSGKSSALFAAILVTSYHFAVQYARIGLNNIWDTVWVPLVVYGFFKGWKERWNGGAVICGVAFGMSQYFYHGSKISFFILLFMVVLLWKSNKNLAEKLTYLIITGLVAVTIAAPLFMYMIKCPDCYFLRARVVWGWKPEAIQAAIGEVNYWKFFWHQVKYTLGTYTHFPDPNGFYGPGIPLVFGPAEILFIAGLVICAIERNWIPLIWIAITSFFGGFLIGVPNSSAHYVAAIPAICWTIAHTLDWIKRNGHRRTSIFLLAVLVITDLIIYFYFYATTGGRDFIYPFPPLSGS